MEATLIGIVMGFATGVFVGWKLGKRLKFEFVKEEK